MSANPEAFGPFDDNRPDDISLPLEAAPTKEEKARFTARVLYITVFATAAMVCTTLYEVHHFKELKKSSPKETEAPPIILSGDADKPKPYFPQWR